MRRSPNHAVSVAHRGPQHRGVRLERGVEGAQFSELGLQARKSGLQRGLLREEGRECARVGGDGATDVRYEEGREEGEEGVFFRVGRDRGRGWRVRGCAG